MEAERQRDSASETEPEEDWEELFDEDQQIPFWFSASRNERVEKKPLARRYEFGLCGMLCKIFWPMEDKFFEGTITRYNKTKNRHRIEYDDGDHEWIDLREEEERVQLKVYDPGVEEWLWMAFANHRPQDPGDTDEDLAEGWAAVKDERALNGVYYMHNETGETQWRKPLKPPDDTGEWQLAFDGDEDDPETQRYWYNTITSETLWCESDAKEKEEREQKVLRDEAEELGLPEGWTRHHDPDQNRWYFFHMKRQLTSWEWPTEEDFPEEEGAE